MDAGMVLARPPLPTATRLRVSIVSIRGMDVASTTGTMAESTTACSTRTSVKARALSVGRMELSILESSIMDSEKVMESTSLPTEVSTKESGLMAATRDTVSASGPMDEPMMASGSRAWHMVEARRLMRTALFAMMGSGSKTNRSVMVRASTHREA
jgi:hypothetical protein